MNRRIGVALLALAILSGCADQVGAGWSSGPNEQMPRREAALVLAGVSQYESAGNPDLISDRTTGRTYRADSQAAAEAIATGLIRKKHDVALGLTQLDARGLGRIGIRPSSVLNQCGSIAVTYRILSALFAKTNNPNDSSKGNGVRHVDRTLAAFGYGMPPSKRGMRYAAAVDRDIALARRNQTKITPAEAYRCL